MHREAESWLKYKQALSDFAGYAKHLCVAASVCRGCVEVLACQMPDLCSTSWSRRKTEAKSASEDQQTRTSRLARNYWRNLGGIWTSQSEKSEQPDLVFNATNSTAFAVSFLATDDVCPPLAFVPPRLDPF